MYENLRMRTKFLVALASIAVVTAGVLGYVGYASGRAALEEESFNKLTAVREMRAGQVEDYFHHVEAEVVSYSENLMVVDAMRALAAGFQGVDSDLGVTETGEIDAELRSYYDDEFIVRLRRNLVAAPSTSDFWPGDVETRVLQRLYIAANSHEVGEKHRLDDAGDGSAYSRAHARYHPVFRGFLERFGYYDLFLVDHETGHIVYSVFKEVDFGTSLHDGPYRETNFAAAFRAARAADEPGFTHLVDFEPYPPSYAAPAAFVASPIFDGGEPIGVLILQMPIDRINDIMTGGQAWGDVGLGASGETYLVGDDLRMRNQSRFLIEEPERYFELIERIGVEPELRTRIRNLNSTIGLQEVRTPGTEAAIRGETGTQVFADYRGVRVLSAYRPLEIPGVQWGIMSEIDEAEAFAHIATFRNRVLVAFFFVSFFIFGVALLFARKISSRVEELSRGAARVAKGDLDTRVGAAGKDEIGDLSGSLNEMRRAIRKLVGKLEDAKSNLEEKVVERTRDLEKATEQVRSIVEIAPDAIVSIGEDQKITLFNPAGEEIFGYSADELIGEPLTTLLPERVREAHPGYVKMFGQAKQVSKVMGADRPVVGRRKDGTEFPGEAGISKADLEGEKLFTVFFRDISERKAMERKLERAFETIKAQKERMEGELNIGREIQMSMLPLIFPAFPNRHEIEVFATVQPAREVGGDFYDFFFMDEDRFCFCIGDVSDKGVPAALFMAVTKALFKSRAGDDVSTASIMTHLNDELSADNPSCMFVTAFAGILNVKTGELRFTNAGHNPPYIKRGDGSLQRLAERHGPVVGAMEGIAYGEAHDVLQPGEAVLMYTDGVTEAMNEQRDLFSEPRLEQLWGDGDLASPVAAIEGAVEAVRRFAGEADQSDDITLLAVEYRGAQAAGPAKKIELTLANDLAKIGEVNSRFSAFAEDNGLPKAVRRQLNMVFDELLNNIISYAFRDDGEHEISVTVELKVHRLLVRIIDDGAPFNPFATEAPDVGASLEERQLGGLGIHLVKNVMDEFTYQRKVHENVVTLVKEIEALRS